MKISLCMIVGNVEEYITRCLTSFAPLADEIIVVRAIGSLVPDRTLDIARDQFGAKTGEYKNSHDHRKWPHLDDFAAARQMSFNLARGEYCFWCDSDDVLEGGGIQIVRDLAARGSYPAYIFPYNIFGRGVSVPRERMMLKSAGQWRYPVHECFTFHVEPVQACEDQRVIVTHLPNLSKAGSNERNLRILKSIPSHKMNAGLWYHLQGELAGAGDIPGSIASAKKALASPDLGRPERYELFLNLARLADDPGTKEGFLHEAYKADPRRREALGLLTCNALDYDRTEIAWSYARQMMATPGPSEKQWNDREAAYTWIGEDIYCQALRACGRLDEANRIRHLSLERAGGPRIALIHATRGRPVKASQTRKLWLDMAAQPHRVEHIFVFDADDGESRCLRRMHHLEIPAGGGCVAAWNHGAFATCADVLVQLSDDWIPQPRWDDLILERMRSAECGVRSAGGVATGNLPPRVLAISDGLRTDQLLCMAICTRAYWGLDFFLFHPWFTGVYSDNWFTELAYSRGMVIEARDIVFTHDHPLIGNPGSPPKWDATYGAQNSPARYAEGRKTIEILRPRADWSSVDGFFNYWPFYDVIAGRIQDGDEIAEVGVWLGRSIIYMAQRLQRQGKPNVRLYAVDTFRGEVDQSEHAATVEQCGGSIRGEFDGNVARCGVAEMIRTIEGDSAQSADLVPDKSLSFVYIDAAHDYESVKRDIMAWFPKVKPGGTMAGHDANHEPVARAVRELLPDAQFIGGVWVYDVPSA